MIKPIRLLFLSAIAIFSIISFTDAQDFKIQTNSLEIINDKLVINYEFSDYKKNQKFEVWVLVTDGHGNKMVAKTFSGDVGLNIIAGKDKNIQWDYMYDNIVIHDEIGIEVKARLMTLDEIALQELTIGGTVLRSAVFPGWGITKATRSKAYLISGAATYITAGLGVFYMLESQKNYEQYQIGNILSTESDFYKKSQSQNTLSNVMYYSAAGIWGVNMIWTIIKTKKLKDEQKAKDKLSRTILIPSYDINTNFKGLTLIYTF